MTRLHHYTNYIYPNFKFHQHQYSSREWVKNITEVGAEGCIAESVGDRLAIGKQGYLLLLFNYSCYICMWC